MVALKDSGPVQPVASSRCSHVMTPDRDFRLLDIAGRSYGDASVWNQILGLCRLGSDGHGCRTQDRPLPFLRKAANQTFNDDLPACLRDAKHVRCVWPRKSIYMKCPDSEWFRYLFWRSASLGKETTEGCVS